jgi:hypothetical protein
MPTLQTVSIIGLVTLGATAVALVLRRLFKEGLSLRGSSRAATPIEVFAECIPLKYPRVWAALFLISYVVLLLLLFLDPR